MISRKLVLSSLNKSLSLRIPLILISFYWQEKSIGLRSCLRSIHMVSTKDVNFVQNTESITTGNWCVSQLLLAGLLLSIVILCYTECVIMASWFICPLFGILLFLLVMCHSLALIGEFITMFRGPFWGYCYDVYLYDHSGILDGAFVTF